MDDNEFLLQDRLQKIKQIIGKYGEDEFYLSFSGGKDSTVLSHLLDIALPDNKIPRVYFNTGIEFKMIEEFCHEKASKDDRFLILNSGVPIKKMLEEEGYPFKSKDHSQRVREFQATKKFTKTTFNYSHRLEHYSSGYGCPKILEEQFMPDYPLKISEKCCTRLKKDIGKKYCIESGKTWVITGIRKSEGGARTNVGCIVQNAFGNKFNPLFPVPNEWVNWYVKEYDLDLCKLYYPPYNFDRTGCKGCPFNIHIQKELELLEEFLPDERKQCEIIWKPVYDEYRRLNYRIKEKKK